MTPLRFILVFACLPAGAVAGIPAGWEPNLTTTATWNSNVPNADRSSDVIGALDFRAALDVHHRFGLAPNDALLAGAQFSVDAWPRFDGLDRSSFGPRLAWQHKFGLGSFAPTVSAELAGDAVFAHESDRSGLAGSVTLAWRKRLDHATRLSLTHKLSRHDARAAVFDRTGAETAFTVERDVGDQWQVSLSGRWREGDVLAYATPPRPDLVALAEVRVPNTTFGRPLVAYSLQAHTVTGVIACSRAFDDTTSLTFAFEARDTTRQPVRYVNHLVSAALARQF